MHTVYTSNSSIWPIDRTLSSATTPVQSVPKSYGNEGVLHIPQSSSIRWATSSDCLVSYPRHSFWRGGLTPLQRCSHVFYSPSQLGSRKLSYRSKLVCMLILQKNSFTEASNSSCCWSILNRWNKTWIRTSNKQR